MRTKRQSEHTHKAKRKGSASASSPKLTMRERKFIAGLAAGKTQKQAAIDAGYSQKSADCLAYQTLQKATVQTAFQKILEKQGITDEKLGEVLAEGLDATKVIACNVIAPNAEGMKDANSMTKDFIDVPDFIARHKFLDTALKLKRHYPAEQVEVDTTIEDISAKAAQYEREAMELLKGEQ